MKLVILVRHGERLDEADRREWHKIRTPQNSSDPPLTAKGIEQSELAGMAILQAKRMISSRYPGFALGEDGILLASSPTTRTLQTAVGVAVSMKVEKVVPHHGLNCCAAAKQRGCEAVQAAAAADLARRNVDIAWPPIGNVDLVNRRYASNTGFVDNVKDIAAAAPCSTIVCVTHREGCWEAMSVTGIKGLRTRYCATIPFWFDEASRELTSALDPSKPWPAKPSLQKHAEEVHVAEAAAPGLTLGSVVAEVPSTTPMVVTPGVMGILVEGGLVESGEAVELLSEPVESEGEGGMFVQARRSNGAEGWLPASALRALA